MRVMLILFVMAYLGMQITGWLLYAFVLFKSGERAEQVAHRDAQGQEI